MSEKQNIDRMESTRKLIDEIKSQFEEENKKIRQFKKQIYRDKDFEISNITVFSGPNYYLDRQAVVFNLFIAPLGNNANFYKTHIEKRIESIKDIEPAYVANLFAETLLQVLKMNSDLFIEKYSISKNDNEYIIAIEYLDKDIAKDCIFFVRDWFRAINDEKEFEFDEKFKAIISSYYKSDFGNALLYNLVKAGNVNNLPFIHIPEEGSFQLGYGNKQLRVNENAFHTDSIKDYEFIFNNEKLYDFLINNGFPALESKQCFNEKEAIKTASEIGYPVLAKPVNIHKEHCVRQNLTSDNEVKKAFNEITDQINEEGNVFKSIIIQKQMFGSEHKILLVDGYCNCVLRNEPDEKNKYKVIDDIHPDNIVLIENIASFFKIKCLEISVFTNNISGSWKETDLKIADINAKPDFIIYLNFEENINLPTDILESHFNEYNNGRIPIIATNKINADLIKIIFEQLIKTNKKIHFGAINNDGIYINNHHLYNIDHERNINFILRNPKVNFALFCHDSNNIKNYGIVHKGADIVILDNSKDIETAVLKNQLFPHSSLIEIKGSEIIHSKEGSSISVNHFYTDDEKNYKIIEIIDKELPELTKKYFHQ